MIRKPNFSRILFANAARTRVDGSAYRVAADRTNALTADEAGAILGITYLMGTANGAMGMEETAFFDLLVEHLGAMTDRDALLEVFEQLRTMSGTIEDVVRAHAEKLRQPSIRELAYKAAYTIRVWDLDMNPAEDAFDQLLLEVLDLRELAVELASEVNAVLMEE